MPDLLTVHVPSSGLCNTVGCPRLGISEYASLSIGPMSRCLSGGHDLQVRPRKPSPVCQSVNYFVNGAIVHILSNESAAPAKNTYYVDMVPGWLVHVTTTRNNVCI